MKKFLILTPNSTMQYFRFKKKKEKTPLWLPLQNHYSLQEVWLVSE